MMATSTAARLLCIVETLCVLNGLRQAIMAEGKRHALAVGVTKMSSAKMYVITVFYSYTQECVLFSMDPCTLLVELQDVLLSCINLLQEPSGSFGYPTHPGVTP